MEISKKQKRVAKKLANTSAFQVFKKDSTLTAHMGKLLANTHSTTIRPCQWVGSGRYRSLQDNRRYYEVLLEAAGYSYKTGNDAPRGGADGFFIKISKPALNFLKTLK